jgi:methyl-accepting chemotaxis protein
LPFYGIILADPKNRLNLDTKAMNLIRHNIRNKLLLLLSGALAIILTAVFIGFASLRGVIDDYAQTVNTEVYYLAEVSALNVEFKTQVQEWKNTLIRAQDPAQLAKYWGSFNKLADVITGHYQSLQAKIPSTHPAAKSLNDFAKSYPQMLQAYQQGYQAFIQANLDISVADKSVKGIDRSPTESLNKAVELVESGILATKVRLEESAKSSVFYVDLGLIVAIVFTILILSWFINTRILAPLNNAAAVSKRIAVGDFTSRIEIQTEDQIGRVVQNFAAIQTGLSKVMGAIVNDIQQLGGVVSNLVQAFNQFKSGLTKQINETSRLTQTMQDMTQSNDAVNQAIEQANSFVKQSADLADTGQVMFKENVDTSHNMLDATNHAAEIIARLKKDTDNIGNVVNVINGIAEQTNLLALNAAIEAARAGESGRGFAVVADEVRTLANKTQESTKQISQNISQLQNEADKAVQAMTQGKEQAEISLSQAQKSQEFVDKLHAVFSQIGQLNHSIELEMQQQDKQTNDINHSLHEIEIQSEKSQAEAIKIDEAAKVLADIYQHINTSTKDFKLSTN